MASRFMRTSISIAIICLLGYNGLAQRSIRGTVTDSLTTAPLAFVSVYINNTTRGTITDEFGNYTLVLPEGEAEIVFSFISYLSHKLRTSTIRNDSTVNVQLSPAKITLESVTIQGSTDQNWERNLKRFTKVFLGETKAAAYCKILNAPYIDLTREKMSRRRTLTATAMRPIEVENLALGYKVFYELYDFSSSSERESFLGNVQFVPIEPADATQEKQWETNRQRAYQGSMRHLFKSILEQRSTEEGFVLSFEERIDEKDSSLAADESPRIERNPATGTYRIRIKGKVHVEHKGVGERHSQSSTMSFPTGLIELDRQGVLLDPSSVITFGYFSTLRVANLLPHDYEPPRTLTKPLVDALLSDSAVPDPELAQKRSLVVADPWEMLDSLEQVAANYALTAVEKVYIHFDKSFYLAGEESWYKAYVIQAPDQEPTDISKILYVDWIDPSGKLAGRQQLPISDGRAASSFAFNRHMQDGIYTVVAYTNWMRNAGDDFLYTTQVAFYNLTAASRAIPTTSKDSIVLQFIPEGGSLINGVKTKIAFKATDRYGKGIPVQGKIVDETNTVVADFRSVHNGMGQIVVIGDVNKSFRAILSNGSEHKLPAARSSGLSLAASNMNSDHLLMRIHSSNLKDSVYLIGQAGGLVCYSRLIVLEGQAKDVAVPKTDLPEGVVQFTLFNHYGRAESERAVFINKTSWIKTVVQSIREKYAARDSTAFTVKLTDRNGAPVQALLSVSVTDADIHPVDAEQPNIYTTLLLQSDLRGYIENPAWYFESPGLDKIYALDLVMLVHGWSRYGWADLVRAAQGNGAFAPEESLRLSGTIFINDHPVSNTPFVLSFPGSQRPIVAVHQTDSLGRFNITGLDFIDSTTVAWRVVKSKSFAAKVKLSEGHPGPAIDLHGTNDLLFVQAKADLISKLSKRQESAGLSNLYNTTVLDEVVVKGRRNSIQIAGGKGILVTPGPEDYKLPAARFISRYAYKLPHYTPTITSDGTMVWTGVIISINGFIADNTGPAGDPRLVLNSIHTEDIQDVQIVGDAFHGYYIGVRTKTPDHQPAVGTIQKVVRGYSQEKEFQHPKYRSNDNSSPEADTRMTLYWNPSLQTDEHGEATIHFYNNDVTSKFYINIEGLHNGLLISRKEVIVNSD